MKILVVDDERIIVQGIMKRLEKMSHLNLQVAGAYSGAEALEIMAYFMPNLLITDIRMPDMQGLTLIGLAKQKKLCENFIILTAYENFEYAKQAIEYQVLNYMVKPIDWEVFEKQVSDLAMGQSMQKDVGEILKTYQNLYAHIDRKDLSHVLSKLVKYIKQNYNKDISLVHLSVYSGVSENYICALFKKELDITFLDYVYELRLQKAMELLLTQRENTIQDIAKLVGYHSDRQFFRMFKSKLDMTPQSFRDMYAV
jgi:two-component system, response regulator YesN